MDGAAISRVAKRIAGTYDKGYQVIAVVSAMGETTNELLELATEVSVRPNPRELDVLLSTGELVSCTLLAMALASQGYKSKSLSGAQAGIKTDMSHGRARINSVEPTRILDELRDDNIVIVAGFQGITDDLDVTTLGRGASDITAVAIAAALGAERCETYTDVEGVFTADPKLVPDACKLDEVGFEEMLELASYGAKMAPRSIEMGMVYDIPILVASSFSDRPGTLIHRERDMNKKVGEIRNRVRAIATDTNVAKITVLGLKDEPGIAGSLFESLAQIGVSVDVIVQNASVGGATDLTFTMKRTDLGRAVEVTEDVARGLGARDVVKADDLAKITIVGTGMQDEPGYAARMFSALAEVKINIELITTSEIRITCIVHESRIGEAARTLHAAFQLDC